MPFINGRYHINPITGAALEAAREAEAALLALQHHAQRDGDESADSASSSNSNDDSANASAPVHRVEIDAAEIVPSHTGRATRGFVARIHRSAPQASAPAGPGSSCAYNLAATPAPATKPETHVFSNHGDLLDFLHDELSKA